MIERDELERLFREANRQAETHQYESAISVYREVITLAGDDDPLAVECAHWGIGEVSLTLGNYTLALEAIESALVLNPDEAAYHFHLGIVYTRTGSRSLALKAMERAYELEPLKPKVLRGYGWTLHRFGDAGRGIKMLLAALALKPDDHRTLRDLGWAFASEARYRESMVCLERSQELDPHDLRTLFALSTVARMAGVDAPPLPIPATGPHIFAIDDDWDDGDLDDDGDDFGVAEDPEDLEKESWEDGQEGIEPEEDWENLDDDNLV
ncbi:tetratricopeptide repeat protein [Gemmatimonadota bacterium]